MPKNDSTRILQLVLHEVRGGAEEHVLSLLRAVRDYGFTPMIAAPASLLETIAPELIQFRVKTLTIKMPTPFNWLYRATQLAGMLTRENVDLVHCHSVIGSFCAGPATYMSRRQPIIETCHGREFWREEKRIKGSFWLDHQISRVVDKYIAVSHATARHLQYNKKIPGSKIVVIHNGRDLTSLIPPMPEERAKARAELGLRDEQTVLLLGRLAVEKGHALLLDALKILGSRRPSLIAMFAGIGPLEDELKAKCETEGLSDRVRFLGYRSDLQKLLASADLVVLPSLSEGLPLAAVEALATARPIVATEVGGTAEVVVNGETGVLIPPGDPVALAEAMLRILSDPVLALRLGMNGRRFVEQHFDVRVQVQRTMALYGDLTNGTNMPSARMVEN
jgi:glycosyltransferase involved in cell wall biosynthesis